MPLKRLMQLIAALAAMTTLAPVFADVNMCVFPRRPVAKTVTFFKPLATHLGQELGEPVNLRVDKDFKEFWAHLESGRCDLVHYNQYHYLLSRKFDYRVIAANVESGSRVIAGSLSVRKDSGIARIEDLRGKTILFGGGPKAMGSYIAPLAILKKAGLEPERDYTVRFAKNPPSAVIGVYNRAADAAGAGNVILQLPSVTKAIEIDKMQVLGESDSFVHLPWAVRGDMDPTIAQRIQSIMVGLQGRHDNILSAAKVDAFQPAADSDFVKVIEIVKFALGEDFEVASAD